MISVFREASRDQTGCMKLPMSIGRAWTANLRIDRFSREGTGCRSARRALGEPDPLLPGKRPGTNRQGSGGVGQVVKFRQYTSLDEATARWGAGCVRRCDRAGPPAMVFFDPSPIPRIYGNGRRWGLFHEICGEDGFGCIARTPSFAFANVAGTGNDIALLKSMYGDGRLPEHTRPQFSAIREGQLEQPECKRPKGKTNLVGDRSSAADIFRAMSSNLVAPMAPEAYLMPQSCGDFAALFGCAMGNPVRNS